MKPFATIKNKTNGDIYHCIIINEYFDSFYVAVRFSNGKRELNCYCNYDYWELVK